MPPTQREYSSSGVPMLPKASNQLRFPQAWVSEERAVGPTPPRGRHHSPSCLTGSLPSLPWLANTCCSPRRDSMATHEVRYYTQPSSPRGALISPRWNTAPLKRVQLPQPVAVESVEAVAEDASCCPLTARQRVERRGEFVLTSEGAANKRYNLRVATLPPKRAGRRTCDSSYEDVQRAASVPPTTPAVRVVSPPAASFAFPPFQPVSVPVYQYEQSTPAAEHYLQQEKQQQQQQLQKQPQQQWQQEVGIPSEPWIRTKFGDMPFSEFEKLNNADSLVSSPRTGKCSTAACTLDQRHRQEFQGEFFVDPQKLDQAQQARAMQEKERLFLLQQQQQQQWEEEARRLYEQQEQQRRQQLQILEDQLRRAEAQRQRELEQLRQQKERRERELRELQRRREEEQRKIEEARQKWLQQMQQERERREQLQRQQQQKEVEKLMQMQERQRQELEAREEQFVKHQERAMRLLLEQQQKEQQRLQQELKGHHEELQQQHRLLREQQEQALRQLQMDHERQQQRLEADSQRKEDAMWRQAPISTTQVSPVLPLRMVQQGPGEVLVETRFGLMPYPEFVALNEANVLKSVPQESCTCIGAHGGPTTYFWGTEATTTSPRCKNALQQNVVHSAYAVPYQPIQHREYFYAKPAAVDWSPDSPRQCLLPSGEEAQSIRAEAQRIGKDAAKAGSQVYDGVRNAINSEVTHGIFRSVGELISDTYQRMRQRSH